MKPWRETRQARWHKRNPWNRYLVGARKRCKSDPHYMKKGIRCLLNTSIMKFLWNRDHAAELKEPSLDRIDPEKNYLLSNCRFIEFEENRKRGREGDRYEPNDQNGRSEINSEEDTPSFA